MFDLTDEVLCSLGGPKKNLRTKNGEKDLNLSIAPFRILKIALQAWYPLFSLLAHLGMILLANFIAV